MTNELLWLLFMGGCFAVTIAVLRLFGREGLLVLVSVLIILSNLQVMKLTTLFGFTVTLGNVLYGSIFFATDLLNEIYGKRAARRGVVLGFLAMILMTGVMQTALRFGVAADPWAAEVQESMEVIFGFMPRLALASLVAYIISQSHDVWAFSFLRRLTRGRHLWLRNNLSTLVSQLMDSVIFCLIAFHGVLEGSVFMEVLVTTYLLKVIIAMLDTPFMYLGRRLAAVAPEVDGGTDR